MPLNIHIQSYPFLALIGVAIIFVLATLLRKDRGAFLYDSKDKAIGNNKILRTIFYAMRNVIIVWAAILLLLRVINHY